METHIQATEDSLIDTLSFKLPNTANFINDRRSVTFFPSGSNEYGPRGVKVMKFLLSGTDWLDPLTVRIQFRQQQGYRQEPASPQSATSPILQTSPHLMRWYSGGGHRHV